MKIGERIKNARKSAGLTQRELADRLGVSFTLISQYERGKRNPKYGKIVSIALALGVPIESLLDEQEMNEITDIAVDTLKNIGYPKESDLDISVDKIYDLMTLVSLVYGDRPAEMLRLSSFLMPEDLEIAINFVRDIGIRNSKLDDKNKPYRSSDTEPTEG